MWTRYFGYVNIQKNAIKSAGIGIFDAEKLELDDQEHLDQYESGEEIKSILMDPVSPEKVFLVIDNMSGDDDVGKYDITNLGNWPLETTDVYQTLEDAIEAVTKNKALVFNEIFYGDD